MLKFIFALLYASAFSSAVFAGYDYEYGTKSGTSKTSEGRKANSEALTGEEAQDRILNLDKSQAIQAQKTRTETTVIQGPKPTDFETPGDALARFNNMKRDGSGAFEHEARTAANCAPLEVKGRNPASVGGVDGFKCTKILAGSGFYKAGIVDGDIVKSVDGKKINSLLVAGKLLRKIENADYSQIVIVRDGRESILAPPLR